MSAYNVEMGTEILGAVLPAMKGITVYITRSANDKKAVSNTTARAWLKKHPAVPPAST